MNLFQKLALLSTSLGTLIAIALIAMPTTSAIAILSQPHQPITTDLTDPTDLEDQSIADPASDPAEFSIGVPAIARVASRAIALPDTGVQNDGWSCGPNSAARVLSYYGHRVDYAKVRSLTDSKLFLPQRFRNPLNNQIIEVRTGTPPQTLKQVMQRWEGDRVKQASKSSFERLTNLVQSGKPAIALVRVGSLPLPYLGTIPYLHWIVVTGIDAQNQKIYYTDTDSLSYTLSYAEFRSRWDLGLDRDISMAIANVLKTNGVQPRTLIWIDR